MPPGSRQSTYQIPQYREVARTYAEPTLRAMEEADPENPTTQPVPYQGIQFVGIPEFQDLGTRVSQQVSAAIAGQTTVGDALGQSQQYAETVGESLPGGAMTALDTSVTDRPAAVRSAKRT